MDLKINGKKYAISVAVFGGATKGGAGWGITSSGKIIKIPDNNPLNEIARLGEVAALTKNAALKTQLEGVIAETFKKVQ